MTDLRIPLNDKTIERLPSPERGRYIVRDTEQKGFFLMVGARKKTFMVQGDLRGQGKRASTVRVAIGDTGGFSTRAARAVAREYLVQISRGIHPKSEEKAAKVSTVADLANEQKPGPVGITLKEAWARYKIAMERKNRSARTIESYRDHVERIFKAWLDTPLKQLGDDPGQVSAKHDAISEENGPTSRMAACARSAQSTIMPARPTASYPQTIPSTASIGTTRSAGIPGWAWLT